MKLILLMFISTCALSNSQRRFRQSGFPQYPSQAINPDAIYFDDNRPQISQLFGNERDILSNRRKEPIRTTEANIQSLLEEVTTRKANGNAVDPNPENVQIKGAAKSLANFSLNLMKLINLYKSGNAVASPFSVATLLSLLQQGSTGTGLNQISAALQMTPQISAASFSGYVGDLQSRQTRNILKTANNLFLANGFSLNPNYRLIAQRDYRCDVTPTSFVDANQAAQDINSWVASETNQKITKIVTPDSLGINTQLVLANAIYFKGLWDIPFRRQSTKIKSFRLANGEAAQVEYMVTRRSLKTGRDERTDSSVITIPFENDEYSLMIILPSTLSNNRDTLSTLTIAQLEKYNNFNIGEVQLELPKFSVKSEYDMVPILKQMGITKMFEMRSDLTRIGEFQSMNPQVTSASHSAMFAIDEEGGTAAAASAFAAVALSNNEPSVLFQVNRPFLAILWDTKGKVPLFLANIENPAAIDM